MTPSPPLGCPTSLAACFASATSAPIGCVYCSGLFLALTALFPQRPGVNPRVPPPLRPQAHNPKYNRQALRGGPCLRLASSCCPALTATG
jgi:hypothetical protein